MCGGEDGIDPRRWRPEESERLKAQTREEFARDGLI